jgi:hypothetical protein
MAKRDSYEVERESGQAFFSKKPAEWISSAQQ